MKQKLLLTFLLAFSMLMFGTMGCEPEEPYPPPNTDHNFGEMTDPRDDQAYNTIEIGTQTWMAENLNYNTGNSWCYDDDPANCEIYGRLYDWETSLTVCPSGWSLPSDTDWSTLTDYLGGERVAGGKMKTTLLWVKPNTGATNESGWSGLPGGTRDYYGSFYYLSSYGYWWSSSEDNAKNAWLRSLSDYHGYVYRGSYDKDYGFSVRCLKD